MMIKFFVHDADGAILRHGICHSQTLFAQAGDGEFVRMGTANDLTEYFDIQAMQVMPKTELVPAITISALRAIIEGLPVPCTVRVDTAEYAVPDSVLDIDFDMPGRYRVRIESVRHLLFEGEVDIP